MDGLARSGGGGLAGAARDGMAGAACVGTVVGSSDSSEPNYRWRMHSTFWSEIRDGAGHTGGDDNLWLTGDRG
jgi:hypothetical protein